MTQTPMQAAAARLAKAFETKERADGTRFYCMENGAPEWMMDAIHEAHQDMLPNDWSYRIARRLALRIDDALTEEPDAELEYELIDSIIPDGSGELASWLASSNHRIAFCDEAREECGVSENASMEARLIAGFYLEARGVFDVLVRAITEEATSVEEADLP